MLDRSWNSGFIRCKQRFFSPEPNMRNTFKSKCMKTLQSRQLLNISGWDNYICWYFPFIVHPTLCSFPQFSTCSNVTPLVFTCRLFTVKNGTCWPLHFINLQTKCDWTSEEEETLIVCLKLSSFWTSLNVEALFRFTLWAFCQYASLVCTL